MGKAGGRRFTENFIAFYTLIRVKFQRAGMTQPDY